MLISACQPAGRSGLEVDIRVLGSWEILAGHRPVAVPSGRLSCLLASLVVAEGRPVALGTLAEQLWPDTPPARVRGTLHTYLGRLRALLGRDRIRTTPAGNYLLDLVTVSVDLNDFHRLLRHARASGSAEEELEALDSALALWRGRPFGGVMSAWLDRDVIPHLAEEWFTATERRIDLELDRGRSAELVAELWDLTNRYPTRESVWLRLMTALHRAGRRDDALAAYQRVRATLHQELGIDPSKDLNQLHHAVLTGG
jgi:DNA-binding SARP family transcriptional activator